MKNIKPSNAYAITTIIVLIIFLLEQLLWLYFRPSDILGVGGVLFLTVWTIIDCSNYWNVMYCIDDEKITFKNKKQQIPTTIFWGSVVTAKSFGWKYCPLAWKTLVINDGKNKIMIRMIGLKEYKELWIFAYDKIREKSPSVITNNNLDKTIRKMRQSNKECDNQGDNQGTVL